MCHLPKKCYFWHFGAYLIVNLLFTTGWPFAACATRMRPPPYPIRSQSSMLTALSLQGGGWGANNRHRTLTMSASCVLCCRQMFGGGGKFQVIRVSICMCACDSGRLDWLQTAVFKRIQKYASNKWAGFESFCSNYEPVLISFMFIKPLLLMEFHPFGFSLLHRINL